MYNKIIDKKYQSKGDKDMARTTKKEIWMNGRYLETARNEAEAERIIARYERQDRYEQSIGYKNPLPTYEIR